MVTEAVEVIPNEDQGIDETADMISIRVKGYLRGRPMTLNSMMYIVGAGTCYLDSVNKCSESFPSRGTPAADSDSETALRSDRKCLDNILFADGDALAGEQTWPTEEEMMGEELNTADVNDPNAGRSRRIVPADIPVGMSDYQADWFVDEDGDVEWDDEECEEEEDGEESDGVDGDDRPDYDVLEANGMLGEERKGGGKAGWP